MNKQVSFVEIKAETEEDKRIIDVFYDNKLIGNLISIKSIYDGKFDEFDFYSVDESDEFGKHELDMSLGEEVEETLGDFKSFSIDIMQEKIKEAIGIITKLT